MDEMKNRKLEADYEAIVSMAINLKNGIIITVRPDSAEWLALQLGVDELLRSKANFLNGLRKVIK